MFTFALNIGLNRSGETFASITPAQCVDVLRSKGIAVLTAAIGQSTTETTFAAICVAAQHEAVRNAHLYELCLDLNQDCIAVLTANEGQLIGPKAEDWGPFNIEYWIDPVTGKHVIDRFITG